MRAAAAALFLPDGHWRDVLAFTWSPANRERAPRRIENGFRDTLAEARPRALRYPEGRQCSAAASAGRAATSSRRS